MSPQIIASIVEVLSTVSTFGAVGFLLAAFAAKPGTRIPKIKVAACFLAALLVVQAGSHAYQVGVALPEQARNAKEVRRLQENEAAKILEGQPAPPFRVKTLAGTDFILSEQRGKVVLINFFATWCGPCMEELPHIENLWNENRDRPDFALLAVDREEDAATARAFVEKKGLTFPVAADPKRQIYSLFAKEMIPRTYLISRDGRVAYSRAGFFEEDLPALNDALARELSKP